ncbi:zinc finger E-box-binding homeobox 2-like isoform X2 [Ambystoma mexicanum]
MWGSAIIQDPNQSSEEEKGTESDVSPNQQGKEPAVDESVRLCSRDARYTTYSIYPRAPDKAFLCRNSESHGLEEQDRKFEPQEAFAQLLICPHCQRGYRSDASLKDHIKEHHKREDDFTCPLCGHTVQFGAQLEQHMAAHSAHIAKGGRREQPQSQSNQSPENRKFKCSECGKSFKYKHHLKEHVRIHSGEKPYECSHCKKRFSHSGSYSSHLNNKKCLPPVPPSGSPTASSPPTATRSGSPEDRSTPSHLQLIRKHPEEQNGCGLQYDRPLNYKVRDISMHCFDSGLDDRRLDFHWDALQQTLPEMPGTVRGGACVTSLSDKVDSLLEIVNRTNGRRSHYQIMKELKGNLRRGQLDTSDNNHRGPQEPLMRPKAVHHGEGVVKDLSYQQCPQGGFGGLRSSGNSTVEEFVSRDHPTLQEQECKTPCKASPLTKACTTNACSPSHAKDHDRKDSAAAKLPCSRQDSMSVASFRELFHETKPPGTAGSPALREMHCAGDLSRDSTIDYQKHAYHHGTLPHLHSPKPALHNFHGAADSSTTEGAQVEPLDLSLPRPSKELPLVPWTKHGIHSQYQGKRNSLATQHELKGYKPGSRYELNHNSLYPQPLYSPFPNFLPSTLNNLLQEQYPLLQMNPTFQGLHFLPYMTYLYGAQPSYLLPSTMQDKHRSMGEFFSLAEHPALEEDTEDGESGSMRKRLKKTDEGLYACDLCDKTFQKSSSLLRHKYEHTGKRPHQCEICQKAFKHKHHLIEHSRLHSGEKPYQCNKCGKRFSHSGSYSQHMNHRYAYCRKDEGSEFQEDPSGTPMNVEESPTRTPSPDRNSESSLADLEPPDSHHGYTNGVSLSPIYPKRSGQELLLNVVP